jgi:hypothetical protein
MSICGRRRAESRPRKARPAGRRLAPVEDQAHREGREDTLVNVAPSIDRCGGPFADLPDAPVSAEEISALRAAEAISRRLGSASFLDRLAAATYRDPNPFRENRTVLC